VLYAIIDQVVDEYAPVVAGLENDIDEIEDQLFKGGDPALARRIYELSREVIEFQRATQPLLAMLHALEEGFDKYEIGLELRRNLRDVSDHVIRIVERSVAQNEEVKKISAWAAIGFAPTIVGTIYGMNFDHMPELHWYYGYPIALALMVASSTGLYILFKRRKWL
jgi:magnesium transporter